MTAAALDSPEAAPGKQARSKPYLATLFVHSIYTVSISIFIGNSPQEFNQSRPRKKATFGSILTYVTTDSIVPMIRSVHH